MTKNEIDIKEQVRNDYVLPESEFDGIYTKTTLFMLPAIDIAQSSRAVKPYFVNAFINDAEYPNAFIRPIFVLFKTTSLCNDLGFYKLQTALQQKKEYITDYDCGIQDGYNLIMFVFQCDKWKEEYYHFKRGRYSKFSPEYKSKFSDVVVDGSNNFVKSIAFEVINKTDTMKKKIQTIFKLDPDVLDSKDELWDMPRKKREYYRYKEPNDEEPKQIGQHSTLGPKGE